MRLNTRSVAALIRPAGKDDVVIWDDDLPGFGIRCRGDNKTYLVQYRVGVQQRRESLGDVRKVSLDDARKAARQRFARAELGIDPAAERAGARAKAAATRLTLGVVAERYLDAKKERMRPSTYHAAEQYFTTHWQSLRQHPLESIKRADVAACLQDISKTRGPISASRARANLSALFGWAQREGLCEANPVLVTNDPAAGIRPRDRVLTEVELATIWKACRDDDDFSHIVKLLMLTAARRREIGELKWTELDLDAGIMTIAAARTKNHRALTLALPPPALDILHAVSRRDDSDNVFGSGPDGYTSWSYGIDALNDRIVVAEGKPLAAWTIHDLRRSAATHMAEIGIQPHIIEAILNHASGHKAGVAGTYNKATYAREITAALQLWAEHLTAIVEGRKGKVVRLHA